MIVAGPPKSEPISFKPGFGGVMFGNSDEELESVRRRQIENPYDFGIDTNTDANALGKERKELFKHLQLIEDPLDGRLGRFCMTDKEVGQQAWYLDVVNNPNNQGKIKKIQ